MRSFEHHSRCHLLQEPERYVELDPDMAATLLDQKEAVSSSDQHSLLCFARVVLSKESAVTLSAMLSTGMSTAGSSSPKQDCVSTVALIEQLPRLDSCLQGKILMLITNSDYE